MEIASSGTSRGEPRSCVLANSCCHTALAGRARADPTAHHVSSSEGRCLCPCTFTPWQCVCALTSPLLPQRVLYS